MLIANLFRYPIAVLILFCLVLPLPGHAQSENDYSAAFWGLDTQGRGEAARLWYEAEPQSERAITAHALYLWQIDTDPVAALTVLQAASDTARNSERLALLEGRIHLAENAPALALASLARAGHAPAQDPDLAQTAAQALLALGRRDAARQRLARSLANAPGHLHNALLAHRLAVEDSDYAAAGEIWAMLGVVGFTRPDDDHGSALYQWNALIEQGGRSAHSARADLLAAWHFYDEAALEYRRAGQSAKAGEMQAIAEYEDQVAAVMDRYYHARALGGDEVEASLWERLAPPVNRLSRALGLETAEGEDLEASIRGQLAQFDARLRWMAVIGETNGRLDLHFGHIVSSDPRPIDQWGQATDIDSVTLFNMPSNGFSRWFWDDHAADGGWVTTGADGRAESRRFIDVLDPKFGAALSRSAMLMDPARMTQIEADWAQALNEAEPGDTGSYDRRADDMIRLLALAPFRQGYETPRDARTAAIGAIVDHFVSTSTVVHEGQHILDTQHGYEGEQWMLEYRAKLTELAYGEHPLFSLAGFYSPGAVANRGGTPHADAEAYLMQAMAAEIAAHPQRYPSIDPEISLWVQLPRLSLAELRSLARTLFEATQTG
ncbi:hypothetical protein [Maricaulis sp.]|uniref:hypothetical protein n=1 Tax=Maricaulis sp. TaxID=1486257 RepID=UPI00263885F7|nr:hypothetical protein [Maricaulis sp.]